MAVVHYTSDLHFGHRLVAGLRGFPTTDEHDDEVATRWRQVVRPDDTVWVLGDLAVTTNRARLAEILDRISGLPGTKHLILGNHDTAHPKHRDAYRHQRTYLQVFESVQVMARRRILGVEVMLSHYPYAGDHTADDRDLQYPAARCRPLAAARPPAHHRPDHRTPTDSRRP